MIENQVHLNKKKPPIVSIGMPVYNGEKYIKEAIDSLLAQTFTDFELVISDNCSTDATQEICLKYEEADSRVRYVRQSQNIGALGNFLRVLNASQSKYFMWAASDDVWGVNWLEMLYGKLIHTNASAAYGQVIPVDEKFKPYYHIAVGQTFGFTGPKLFRKCKYYLDYEGRGKANLIYSLYLTDSLKKVDITGVLYDYSIILNLLSDITFESVRGVYTYKRNHNDSADKLTIRDTKFFTKLLGILFPIPVKLFLDYFQYCNYVEKALIVILLPMKIVIAYFWMIVIAYKGRHWGL